MKKDKHFPYCNEYQELYFRTVLIEKYRYKPPTDKNRCTTINGIAVFSNLFYDRNRFDIVKNDFGNVCVVFGNFVETIKTDSFVIQMIVKAIADYEEGGKNRNYND